MMRRMGRARWAREVSHIPARSQKEGGGEEEEAWGRKSAQRKSKAQEYPPTFQDNKLETIQVE